MSALAGRYIVNPESGCHEWQGSLNSNGYGKLKLGGRLQYAHRVAYAEQHGIIDPTLTIDHLCRNRSCCNPDHLEAVSLKENVARSPRARKDHCSRGHPLVGGNLYVDPKGYWKCRSCKRSYASQSVHGRFLCAS